MLALIESTAEHGLRSSSSHVNVASSIQLNSKDSRRKTGEIWRRTEPGRKER